MVMFNVTVLNIKKFVVGHLTFDITEMTFNLYSIVYCSLFQGSLVLEMY